MWLWLSPFSFFLDKSGLMNQFYCLHVQARSRSGSSPPKQHIWDCSRFIYAHDFVPGYAQATRLGAPRTTRSRNLVFRKEVSHLFTPSPWFTFLFLHLLSFRMLTGHFLSLHLATLHYPERCQNSARPYCLTLASSCENIPPDSISFTKFCKKKKLVACMFFNHASHIVLHYVLPFLIELGLSLSIWLK